MMSMIWSKNNCLFAMMVHTILSTHIDEAKKIGRECANGDISDCNEGIPVDEVVPEYCQGVLIFSDTAFSNPTTCGKYCDDLENANETSNLRRTFSDDCSSGVLQCGWTKFMRFQVY